VRVRVVVACLIGSCTSGGPDEPSACAPTTRAEAAACVDDARYTNDVDLLAVPRAPGSAGWQAAQDHCRDVLTDAGFAVELHTYGTGTNAIGRKAGVGTDRRTIVVSAHYDSVPQCNGADDNATGVAAALGLARALSSATFEHDLVVACWDEEERGLIGSLAYAERAKANGEDIEVGISFEMLGYVSDAPNSQELPLGFELVFPEAVAEVEARDFRGDFIALVADADAAPMVDALVGAATEAAPMVRLDIPPSLLGSPALSDLARSDHAAFWNEGFAGIMITDTANFRYGGYHCADGEDAVERLDLNFAAEVTRATTAAVFERLGYTATP